MKTTRILYWIFTILFAAFMLFTVVGEYMDPEQSKKFMDHLGYPPYFTMFLNVWKVLGCIALLVPAFPRLKEWAYAGFFFDLTGAVYSNTMVDGVNSGTAFMILPFALFFLSYIFWHKYYKAKLATGN